MKVGSPTHIIMFLVTALFVVLTCIAVNKMPRKWQNFMIVLSVVICSATIFFRFAMGNAFGNGIKLGPLLLQQLQVCNFNFILLPLTLIPKFKLARQYAFYFSMFAAATTLVALNSRWGNAPWYSATVMTSWIYHTFAIVTPLWMFSAGRLRPERKYIIPVSICVFCYFTLVYIISEILKGVGIMGAEQSFSYIYNTDGIPILDTIHKWINVPYFHLYPSFFIVVGFFYLLSLPFTRTVEFDGNGGDGAIKKLYGTTKCPLKLPHGGFIREGYVVIGWSTASNGEVEYLPGETIIVNKRLKLYAVWGKIGEKDN